MTPHVSVALLCSLILIPAARADLIDRLRFNGMDFVIQPDFSAWSDATPDASTVRATLVDNPTLKRWEFRLWGYQSGSPNLSSGLDVTLGTDIRAEFFVYPNGHAQAPKSFYIYGTDIRNVEYSLNNATFRLNFRPVAPAITASYNGGFTAIAGIDFPYYGSGQTINYTPPMISGNVLWDDLSRSQHPTSQLLLGAAIRVNGVNEEPVTMDFFLGQRYANRWSYDVNETRGYLDGEVPDSGFTATLSDPGISITTDVPNDSFKKLNLINYRFSAHDLQAGVFLQFTNVVREAGGVRLYWNPQTTNLYTIQYTSVLGGPTNILGTNLPGPSVLDSQALTNPARFYRLRGQ